MMRPKLVREITNSNGATVTRIETSAYRQVVSPQVAQTLASYMYEAVQSGTASKAAISGAIAVSYTHLPNAANFVIPGIQPQGKSVLHVLIYAQGNRAGFLRVLPGQKVPFVPFPLQIRVSLSLIHI